MRTATPVTSAGGAGRRLWLAAIVVVLSALGLAVAACGGGDDDGSAAPRPISEILDGEIRLEDIGPASATVRVTTTLPVVCSVVFGTDTSYGSLSTDPDMGGAAHADHEAPLRGLEPDTEYHYRLQGTGPDGTLYVSEDRTFRTTAATPGQAQTGVNLASLTEGARVAGVSSVYGDSATWQAENALDGDPATEWSSQGDGDAAFLTVELAGKSHITAVGVWTRTMGSSAQITEFRVVTDRGETLGPFRLPDANEMHLFEVDATARTLRYEVISSSGGNTGVVELAAYANDAP